jgi:hypothetical protein
LKFIITLILLLVNKIYYRPLPQWGHNLLATFQVAKLHNELLVKFEKASRTCCWSLQHLSLHMRQELNPFLKSFHY